MGFISSKLLISDNDWFRSSLPVSAEWKALEYSNGIFVALASYGPYATPVPQRAAYSYNGTKWFAGTINQATGWRSIAYGNGRFVAVGETFGLGGAFAYSDDGITWNGGTPAHKTCYSVTYGNGRFVAVGYVNNHDLNINGIVYSDNGANWTAVNTQKQRWQSVAFGNGRFVAASVEDAATGPGVLAYSNNGITWTILSAPTSASGWSSVAYGDGKFIAVKRYTSDMAYSYDGITWTSFSPSPSSPADAYKIKYDGMKFVGLLNGGNMNISNRLPYSYNGLDWGYLGIPQGRWTDTTSNGEKLICIQASSSLILSK
jgi:hypothetical protein